ncbi:hypothetical protein [Demequina litorisediminis]|nr:hypothetical protein [Demequina litorisediminis]
MRIAHATTFGAIALTTLTLAACSAEDADAEASASAAAPSASASTGASTESTTDFTGQTVTVVTHDSFAVPDDVLAAFEESTGLTVEFTAPGDAGALVNQAHPHQGRAARRRRVRCRQHVRIARHR